jgi:hypothetical protein
MIWKKLKTQLEVNKQTHAEQENKFKIENTKSLDSFCELNKKHKKATKALTLSRKNIRKQIKMFTEKEKSQNKVLQLNCRYCETNNLIYIYFSIMFLYLLLKFKEKTKRR